MTIASILYPEPKIPGRNLLPETPYSALREWSTMGSKL